jgi:hypothetical protein
LARIGRLGVEESSVHTYILIMIGAQKSSMAKSLTRRAGITHLA